MQRWAFRTRGLAPYLGLRGDPKSAAAAATSARMAMEDVGGMFVKLGQLLAGRADLLPVEARGEFGRLHERTASADPAAVLALLEVELGTPPTEIFKSFDTTPVAAASIAQAHAARLSDGTDVIVKIQRPGIDAVVHDDLAITRWLARMVERSLVGQIVLVLAAAGGLCIGLLSLTGGPMVTSGLSMHHAFGYAGLTLSLILLLRVLTAVLRDDR